MSALQTDVIAALRPRTVGELIDGAFRLYRRNFRAFLVIVAVVYLPVRLLTFGADVFLLGKYTLPGVGAGLVADNIIGQVSTLEGYIEQFLTYFAQWALTIVVANAMLGQAVNVKEVYDQVLLRAGSVIGLIGLQIFIALDVLIAPLLLLILITSAANPGGVGSQFVILSGFLVLVYAIIIVRLQVVVPAAAMEDLSPGEALGRSWELTHNYWWRTLALSLVLDILALVVTIAVGTVLVGTAVAALKFDYYTDLAIRQSVDVLVTAIFMPVQIAAIALYYFDLRVRKEGFDLETAIAQRYSGGQELGYSEQFGAAGYEPRPSYYPPSPPLAYGSRAGAPRARSVRQDQGLYVLLGSGQADRAMRTFQRRATRQAGRQPDTGASPHIKRKRDSHPVAKVQREGEQ